MKYRTLSPLILLLLLSCALAATTAYACTGFLVKEELVRSKRGGHTRLCYYDHLGDLFVVTVPDHRRSSIQTAMPSIIRPKIAFTEFIQAPVLGIR